MWQPSLSMLMNVTFITNTPALVPAKDHELGPVTRPAQRLRCLDHATVGCGGPLRRGGAEGGGGAGPDLAGAAPFVGGRGRAGTRCWPGPWPAGARTGAAARVPAQLRHGHRAPPAVHRGDGGAYR